MRLDDPENPIAVEILQETAAAYFAGCRKMAEALAALREFDFGGGPAASGEPAVRSGDRLAGREALLEAAAERVHFVMIQREAMRLSGAHRFLDEHNVPAAVRRRLGLR